MSKIIHRLKQLVKNGVIKCPPFLLENLQLLVITGSTAYGVAEKNTSDIDLYGMTMIDFGERR